MSRTGLVILVLTTLAMCGCCELFDDCTETISVSLKVVNQSTICTENTVYVKYRYTNESGMGQGQLTVPSGSEDGVGIPAFSNNNDGKVDLVIIEASLFDPDPVLGCGSFEGGYQNTFQEGDLLTITILPDGTFVDEITPATSRAPLSQAVSWLKPRRPQRPLQPIPDPIGRR